MHLVHRLAGQGLGGGVPCQHPPAGVQGDEGQGHRIGDVLESVSQTQVFGIELAQGVELDPQSLKEARVLNRDGQLIGHLGAFRVPITFLFVCIEISLQGPTGGNTQGWQFVVVFDAEKRAALAELYRKGWAQYKQAPGSLFELAERAKPGANREQMGRVASSADYLADHLEQVPVHVIPCIPGRMEGISGPAASVALASVYGSILPATWNYMLAARNRGLGTCWTTVHLIHEKEAAELLGIPYKEVTQVALIPTAYSLGTDFKKALRNPVDDVLHIDGW